MEANPGQQSDAGASDIYSCSICFDDMLSKTPRSLSCLHTFCEPCLLMLLSTYSATEISCPTCRQVTPLPDGNVRSLPKNFLLRAIQTTEEKTKQAAKLCQRCRSKGKTVEAVLGCVECEVPFCSSCSELHVAEKEKASHTLIVMDDYCSTARCQKHQRMKRLYCFPCGTPLCIVCRMEESHQSHFDKVLPVARAVDHIIAELNQTHEEAKNMVDIRIAKMTAALECIDTNKQKTIECFDEIILKAQEAKARLLKELTNDYSKVATETMWKYLQQNVQLQQTKTRYQSLRGPNFYSRVKEVSKSKQDIGEIKVDSIPALNLPVGLRRSETDYEILSKPLDEVIQAIVRESEKND